MSGIIILLTVLNYLSDTSHTKVEFSIRSTLIQPVLSPYLDKLQDIGFIPRVKSQSNNSKFDIQCLVF